MRPLVASALVPAPAEAVFGVLGVLENHWRLADRWVEVMSLDGGSAGRHLGGGRVRMRGPLGVSRVADTRVCAVDPPRSIDGTAELRSGTRARVSWGLEPVAGGTRVRLGAVLERATTLDRLLLALGGRWWLRRRFRVTLTQLAALLEEQPARSRHEPAAAASLAG